MFSSIWGFNRCNTFPLKSRAVFNTVLHDLMRKKSMEKEGRGAERSKGKGVKNKMLLEEVYGHADILKSKRKHS